jgi:hypothetical protein
MVPLSDKIFAKLSKGNRSSGEVQLSNTKVQRKFLLQVFQRRQWVVGATVWFSSLQTSPGACIPFQLSSGSWLLRIHVLKSFMFQSGVKGIKEAALSHVSTTQKTLHIFSETHVLKCCLRLTKSHRNPAWVL